MKESIEIDERKTTERGKKRPLPEGLPYLVTGAVFFILSMLLPVYRMWGLVTAVVIGAVAGIGLAAVRKKQLAELPPETPQTQRTQELSNNLDEGSRKLQQIKTAIKNPEVQEILGSIAETLCKLADNLEKNPEDRSRIRKVAVHYVPRIIALAENYRNLEAQGIDGKNITASMKDLEAGLGKIDTGLKQYLDDMFEDDKTGIAIDLEVLTQMMSRDGKAGGETEKVNQMDFSDL